MRFRVRIAVDRGYLSPPCPGYIGPIMKIATSTLACLLGLGFTACVSEASEPNDPEGTSKTASKETSKETPKATPTTVGMTTTALELSRVP